MPEPQTTNLPVIAGFQILSKVGQGGMGSVFRARQISMDRIVALKILPKRLAQDPQYKERFFREARLSAKLNHLNIINAIDCGEDGGYTYFAMEFVEGKTAKLLLHEKGRLEIEEGVEIVCQIARALGYAETHRLIHRDIKPDNIMLTTDGTAKLCDLGLARSTERKDEDASLTQTGMALGTPHYISPEQARGESDLDIRTDIYSLGATFYHLLAGRTLFDGATAAVIMAKHLAETGPALSEVRPDVPEAIAAIVSKMLAKEPKDRYANAGQLLADLEVAKAGKTPAAAGFRSESSCTPPSQVARGGRRKGKDGGLTTGPRSPVGARGTTGPRAAIMPQSTGYAMPVAARGTTGPAAPVTSREAAHAPPQRDAAPAVWIGVGVAVVILIFIIGFGSRTPPESTASKIPTTPRITERPPAAKPENPGLTTKPKPLVPVAEKPAPPAFTPPAITLNPLSVPPVKNLDPTQVPAPDPRKVEPPPPAPPAVPSPPSPSAGPDSGVDGLYAKFLNKMIESSRKLDLGKTAEAMKKLAGQPEFALAKETLAAELKDLEGAVQFEREALAALAKDKSELPLPKEMAKLAGVPSAKISEYNPSQGLAFTVRGATFWLSGAQVPPKVAVDILDASGKVSAESTAGYLLARGALTEAYYAVRTLPDAAPRKRLERKLDLMKAGKAEMDAQEAFQELAAMHGKQLWKALADQIAEFRKTHGASREVDIRKEELAAMLAAAERALEPPNPLAKILHARTFKGLPGGFAEVYYDFSTPDQLKDFDCEHDLNKRPHFENGWMKVPPFGGEWSHARFVPPVVEVQRIEVVGKTLQPVAVRRSERFGVCIFPPGTKDGNNAPRCIFRIYNRTPHLERWENQTAGILGPQPEDWSKEVTFQILASGKDWKWTVNGKVLPAVKFPDSAVGGNIAFFGVEGEHVWTKVKFVFKSDPDWIKRQLELLKSGKP